MTFVVRLPKREVVSFTPVQARFRYVDRASRQALVAVCGREFANQSESFDEVLRLRTLSLLSRRRQRQAILRRNGLEVAKTHLPNVWFNCPPAGVLLPMDQHGWAYCRQLLLCPFCWSREYVYRAYNSLEHVLYQGRREPRPLSLTVVVRHFEVPQQPPAYDCLDSVLQLIRDQRGWLYRRLPAVGGLTMWTVAPSDPRKQTADTWLIEERTLAVLPQDAVASLPSTSASETCRRVREFPGGTRAGLTVAVGYALRYPRQLMFGPVAPLVALCNYRRTRPQQFRLFTLYGEARNREARCRGEQVQRGGQRPKYSKHSR